MLIKGSMCGYCNSLFLCCSNRYTSGRGYFVYDPFTKESTQIPLFPGAAVWKEYLYAIGFNSITKYSTRNFSVVLVNSFIDTIHHFKVNVFSSEIGKWSQIIASVENGFAFAPQWMLSFAHREYLCFMGQTKILMLDPNFKESDSYTIDYPEGVDGMNLVNYGYFGCSGEFLRIADIGHNNELRVWELIWKKDEINDNNESSPYQAWLLVHMTNLFEHLPAQFCGNYFKRVAGFHPYDVDIVYLHSYVDVFSLPTQGLTNLSMFLVRTNLILVLSNYNFQFPPHISLVMIIYRWYSTEKT